MSVKADEDGFIAVHPEALGTPQTWHFGVAAEAQTDLMFFRDLINNLESQWSIDPKRIYVTGMLNGAQMTNHLGCELSDIIAAIGPVSGGYPSLQNCNPVQPLPVVSFHGTADNLIPYEGQGQILLPAREWAAGWASHNGCDQTPKVPLQKGQVTGGTWANYREGADVIL